GFEEDVKKMHAMGLAKGGSLENAVVVGQDRVLNADGLRYTDEFVRHKMLDCVGDLYLAGAQILGRFDGFRTGHGINNRLLRALFSQKDAWERISAVEMPSSSELLGRSAPQRMPEAASLPLH